MIRRGGRRPLVVTALAVTALVGAAFSLSACSPTSSTGVAQPTSSGSAHTGGLTGGLTGELTIFAAASLTASFGELASAFAADHKGVTVNPISFDGSSTLATQINEGAPADVFASADQANMAKVSDRIGGEGTVFATNVLQIAVQPGNPKHITGLADLANPEITTVLCAPAVPCGTASHTLLDLDRITVTPASEEQNVKAVLTKVQLGEADAGLVYATDVAASAGAVDGIRIANADRAVNHYPIAVLKDSTNLRAAKVFVAFVLSPEGQKILATYGFGTP